jgi:glycosyltransferase involved in cell wall biosynthesis
MPRIFVNLLQSTGTKGGIEVYARELYRTLGAIGSEFEYVGYASSELAARDHSWFPGEMIDSRISGENRIPWAAGELFSVGAAASRAKADLIHGPAMFGPLRPGRPLVISFHDLLYFSHPELMQTSIFTGPVKWMERRGAAGATRLITISEYSARAIDKYLGFPRSRVDVIPLAGRARPAAPEPASARRNDLFLAMGQRSPYKNFETVVRALATIEPAERPHLVITGSHGDDPLAPLVAELELAPWVELKGWVSTEELDELTSSATALIDATLASGFSLPALEAMMIGLPLLMADTEVFREVAADAADYFDPTDPASLGRAITALGNDRERQGQLAVLGYERARGFSWEKVARSTLDSFRTAISDYARS